MYMKCCASQLCCSLQSKILGVINTLQTDFFFINGNGWNSLFTTCSSSNCTKHVLKIGCRVIFLCLSHWFSLFCLLHTCVYHPLFLPVEDCTCSCFMCCLVIESSLLSHLSTYSNNEGEWVYFDGHQNMQRLFVKECMYFPCTVCPRNWRNDFVAVTGCQS